jgi:hypothetical protein
MWCLGLLGLLVNLPNLPCGYHVVPGLVNLPRGYHVVPGLVNLPCGAWACEPRSGCMKEQVQAEQTTPTQRALAWRNDTEW